MLDIHAVTGTPGATTTLTALGTICPNDKQVVAGVPISDKARLIIWGSLSLVANTIYLTRLQSQDQIDPLNGERVNLGTASLQNEFHKYTNLPYQAGARVISQTTNTAQTATSIGFTMDHYEAPSTVLGKELRFAPNQISIGQTLNVNVAVTWVTTGFAPATAIPNGKYALLGARVALLTDPALIRFEHADFGKFTPGFPVVEEGASAILGFQKGTKDELLTAQGYQFIIMSELTGKPCVPVFSVSNAGTGLNIQMVAPTNTDTPQVTLNLVKVG